LVAKVDTIIEHAEHLDEVDLKNFAGDIRRSKKQRKQDKTKDRSSSSSSSSSGASKGNLAPVVIGNLEDT